MLQRKAQCKAFAISSTVTLCCAQVRSKSMVEVLLIQGDGMA